MGVRPLVKIQFCNTAFLKINVKQKIPLKTNRDDQDVVKTYISTKKKLYIYIYT